ncbi:Alpha-amylase [Microbacterium sp. 8M]|uniref:carbohydrate-binding module family 20 domain-containing protein n=1 Tax=Microbacterium sp. 8M TaxID=2653153 RepID=UPI0012F0B86C|nr:carbohydrate-binding module family 20 domain-containing protein [Microbacterium sp. 8M]VXB37659.1 Alpha-amylase [Microbacterium sp. 8M]
MPLDRRAAAHAPSRRTTATRAAWMLTGALAVGALVPLAMSGAAQASTPNGGDVVANLFEWNWHSVAAECTNVLGPKGYGAVQVAPPQDSVRLNQSTHPWWEVYQPVGYDLNSRMGTAAQFAAMVTTCHNAGVKVYVDAVLNHMAGDNQTTTDSYGGVSFSASSHSYAQPGYTASDFHAYPNDCPNSNLAINDWNNQTQVQECELVSLEDLKTESSHVRSTETAYLNQLVDLGVDGFRLDAAKHINANDLSAILSGVHNTTWTGSRPYVLQEVMPGGSGGLAPSAYEGMGQVIEFTYATALKNQFTGNIANLATLGQSWGIEPSASSGTMVTNHDTERNGSSLNYKAGSTYVLANVFHLAWGYGTPQVYASFTWNSTDDSPPSDANGFVTDTDCANGWYCTDRTRAVANMVGWRNAATGQPVANWYSDGANLISFSRGSKAWVAINNGTSAQTRTFATGLPAGSYCDVIHGDYTASTGACTGTSITVDSSGNASVTVPAKDAVALYGLTGTATPTPTPTGSSTPTPTPTAGQVAETFTVNGETGSTPVYLVGSIAELGSWAPASAIPMTQSGSSWTVTVNLPQSTAIQYKYIQKDASGTVTWESGSNHTATTGSGATASLTDQLNGTTATPPPAPTVAVTFNENETTTWGSNVYVVGSIPALGSWNTGAAIKMDPASYPVWSATVSIPASTAFQYKYIVKDANGAVTWESGANRSYTTGSSGSVTLNDTWK